MSDHLQNESLRLGQHGDVIVAVGEIDLAGGPLLDDAFRSCEEAGTPIALDLSQVTFVDSSGLRSLIGAAQRAADGDRRVRLIAPTAVVTRLLEITATTSMFDIVAA